MDNTPEARRRRAEVNKKIMSSFQAAGLAAYIKHIGYSDHPIREEFAEIQIVGKDIILGLCIQNDHYECWIKAPPTVQNPLQFLELAPISCLPLTEKFTDISHYHEDQNFGEFKPLQKAVFSRAEFEQFLYFIKDVNPRWQYKKPDVPYLSL